MSPSSICKPHASIGPTTPAGQLSGGYAAPRVSRGKPSRLLFGAAVWLLSMGVAFAHLTDQNAYPPLVYSGLLAAVGDTYTDAIFGTPVHRISDAVNTPRATGGGNLDFVMTEYSTMSPFSQDGSRLILQHVGYYGLYDGAGNFLRNLPFEISASSEPRWSRSEPRVLYFVVGNQLKQFNVDGSTASVVHTFAEYSSISGRGESDISFDGDHFVFVGDNRYIFVYTISSAAKSAVFDTGGQRFDSLYITPNNNVTVTWLQAGSARYNGIELFDGNNGNMQFLRQLTRAGGHMDVGRDTKGDEVLLWANAADPAPVCNNGVVKVRISDGSQTCLATFDWSLALNVSAPDNSGWVFVATYAPGDPDPLGGGSWPVYTNEIVQVKLDGSEVRRLAHHRSRPLNGYNYTPRPSVSRDGAKLAFSSNFGMQESGYPTEYADAYLIDLSGGGGDGGGDGGGGGGDVGGGGAPAAPSNLVATAVSGSQIDLTWDDNSSNENAFKLQRQPSGGSWTTVDWPAANKTSYSDTGLSAGSYCYRIRSHSAGGFSAYVDSTPACVTIGGSGGGGGGGSTGGSPAAPSNLVATAVSASQIDLTWTDNSSDENAFKLQRQPSGGSWTTVTWASGNQTSYSDTGLSAGSYCYRIRSHSADGFSAYVESTPDCVTIGGGGDGGGSTPPPSGGDPAAPSNFTATSPVSGRVDLTWVDNSDDEHSFKLQWAPAGTENWSTIWVFKNETSFSHTGLPDGTFCYRIRSHNTDGFSSYVLSSPNCVSVGSGGPSASLLDAASGFADPVPPAAVSRAPSLVI